MEELESLRSLSDEDGKEMKKIIQRNITNEDGDAYGIVGDITRLGAYKAIRQDLRGYGVEDDVEFKPEDLQQITYYETVKCPHNNAHEDYTWWGDIPHGEKVKSLGKGWIYYCW